MGGKLLGAGGGGFLLFYVPEEKQGNVKKALDNLLHVPFAFEDAGTDVIYYSPENYSPDEWEENTNESVDYWYYGDGRFSSCGLSAW